MTAEDPALQAAEKEYYSTPHPAFGARVVSYWRDGRMTLQELACGRCVCGVASLHETAPKVMAALVTGRVVLLPPEVPVWHVQSGAPSADEARSVAVDVAKMLGWRLNPLFVEQAGDVVQHVHTWATVASWPSGPDGQVGRTSQCTSCPAVSTSEGG